MSQVFNRSRMELSVGAVAGALLLSGCDPVIEIFGATFPGWLFCILGAMVAAALCRPVLGALEMEPFLRPLPLFYTSLIALFALIAWTLFFSRG